MTAEIIELDTDAPPSVESIISWLLRHRDEIDHITMLITCGDYASIAYDDRTIAEIVCDCRQMSLYGDSLLTMMEDGDA